MHGYDVYTAYCKEISTPAYLYLFPMAGIELTLTVEILSDQRFCVINHPRGEPLDGIHAKRLRESQFHSAISRVKSTIPTIAGRKNIFMPFRCSVSSDYTLSRMASPETLTERITAYWTELHRTAHEVYPREVHARKQLGYMREDMTVYVHGVMIEKYIPNPRGKFYFYMLHILTSVHVEDAPSLIYTTVELLRTHMFGFFVMDSKYPAAGCYDYYDQRWHILTCIKFDDEFREKHPEFYDAKLYTLTPSDNLLINVRVMTLLARHGILFRNTKKDVLHVQTKVCIAQSQKQQDRFLKHWNECLQSDCTIVSAVTMNEDAFLDVQNNGVVRFSNTPA
jgi:hypothetical protein